MVFPRLHDGPAPAAEAVELQQQLAGRVDTATAMNQFDLVAGCDIADATDSGQLFAAVVVLQTADGTGAEASTVTAAANFPYVPSLLSFREAPPLMAEFRMLRHTPDVVILDGQRVAHPRRFGLACHLGLWLGMPSQVAHSEGIRRRAGTGRV